MPNVARELPKPDFVRLELRTAYGPVFRHVSTNPPREARPDEIPVIDISDINGGPEQRQGLAKSIKEASENTGFFYIKNHGIPDHIVAAAQEAAKTFFKQPIEKKLEVSKSRSQHFNGYSTKGTSKASPSEGSMLDLLSLYRSKLTQYSRLSRSIHVAIRSQVRSRGKGPECNPCGSQAVAPW